MIIDAGMSRSCCGTYSYPASGTYPANSAYPTTGAYPATGTYPTTGTYPVTGSYSTTYPTNYGYGCGCCSPLIPPCPTSPVAATISAVSNQQTAAVAALAVGDSVPFDSTGRAIGTDISYNSTNNAFVINTPGTYFFTWDVLAEATGTAGDILLRLQTLDGMTSLAFSGADNAAVDTSSLISGSTIVSLPAGASVVLVNAGTAPIALPEAGTAPQAFVAGMTVVRIA